MGRNLMGDYWDIETAKEIAREARPKERAAATESDHSSSIYYSSFTWGDALINIGKIILGIPVLIASVTGFFVITKAVFASVLLGGLVAVMGFVLVVFILVNWLK